MKRRLSILAALLTCSTATAISAEHVIMISADGLRPAAVDQLLENGELPHFARLQAEGAWTHNARPDYDNTFTSPNHVTMVTGRPVSGTNGHNYTNNGTPSTETTLHTTKGSYVHSVFDVSHDHGLTTSIHRSKSKLVIIDQSYTATTGGEDETGVDNGRSKIDTARFSVTNSQAGSLMDLLETDLLEHPIHLVFLHLVDPDAAGHGSMWETSGYFDAVRRIDAYLGRVLDLIEENEPYAGRTTIILTADHGGFGAVHSDPSHEENYVIPFYVWGADVPAAGDLYAINSAQRLDPAGGRPEYGAGPQPIRNGDIGNLALDLLGLPAIPHSTINAAQDLRVAAVPQGKPRLALRHLPTGAVQLRWAVETPGTVQVSSIPGRWEKAAGVWPSKQRYWVDPKPVSGTRFFRVIFD